MMMIAGCYYSFIGTSQAVLMILKFFKNGILSSFISPSWAIALFKLLGISVNWIIGA